MLQLYINFSADEHVMIYTYRNFISRFLQINTCWYIHAPILYQLSCRWTPDDIYIPQLYINFRADGHVMIYTYRNFITTFLQMYTRWDIHTATLYQFSTRWKRDDTYIPLLYINFPADEHVMIYTCRNFISIFLQMNTWWYIHTLTLYKFSCRWTPDDIYMSQLYFNFPADEHLVIYTYRNFISIFLQINTWWYIHVVTFFNFPADKRLMIYTYPNFIWNFLQMNTWWYIHTTTLYQFSYR